MYLRPAPSVVNVVSALVVLVALAVVAAGGAFALQANDGSGEKLLTENVTLDIRTQPGNIVAELLMFG